MTRDEILNMPAGREMDALVAEKVMGLVPCQAEIHKMNPSFCSCHANADTPAQGGETHCYSTDIAAAWEVVEKLRSEAFCLFRIPGGYLVEFSSPRGADFADTAPLAICRASLLAVLAAEKGIILVKGEME